MLNLTMTAGRSNIRNKMGMHPCKPAPVLDFYDNLRFALNDCSSFTPRQKDELRSLFITVFQELQAELDEHEENKHGVLTEGLSLDDLEKR